MKKYIDKKTNSLYLNNNLSKVGDLKPGFDIIVSIEKAEYLTDKNHYTLFTDKYDINITVPVLNFINLFETVTKEFIEQEINTKNFLGNFSLSFKMVDGYKCLILTLSEELVSSIKSVYKENTYIMFDPVMKPSLEYVKNNSIDGTVAILVKYVHYHTEEEVEKTYNDLAEKILSKEEDFKKLLRGESIPTGPGYVQTKNGYEKEICNLLFDYVPLLKVSNNKVETLKSIFNSLEKIPYIEIFLCDNEYGKLHNIDLITRMFK